MTGRTSDVGTFYIPKKRRTPPILKQLADEKGLVFDSFDTEVSSSSLRRVRPARIALWDQYGGAVIPRWGRFGFPPVGFPQRGVFSTPPHAGQLVSRVAGLVPPPGATLSPP